MHNDSRAVAIAIQLSRHSGGGVHHQYVASPEVVSETTADLINSSRARGGRVIAVGTTATRAIESAVQREGTVAAASGWTGLVISPERPVRVVNGLITGWHNPDASHLLLVESVAGAQLTQRAYDAAAAEGYLWHEFGDSCLLIRDG